MKKSLLFFCSAFLLLSSFCFSQNKDSLWLVYNNKSKADTVRLKALYDLANSYLNNNPYTAIVFAQLELQLAEKTNQQKYQAKALNLIGVLHKNKGLYPSALDN
ncbi:MAG TPA: hypothetical protein VN698_10500, partial [Bacteroidia bacterium]|nr:hypothetical protein [Bacteroidia bacterium]